MEFRVQTFAYPLRHVTVKQRVVLKSGKSDEFILLYIKPSGSECPIVFKALFNYFSDNASKSLSWQRHVARAVGLFYDFCVAKADVYKNDNSVADAIRGFVECSLNGDAGLGWAPSSIAVVKRNFNYILEFSQAMTDSLGKSQLPPDGNIRLRYFYRAYQIKHNVSLSHITDVKSVAARLQTNSSESIYNFPSAPIHRRLKVFPEELIEPLFKYGFSKRDGSEDLVGKMITALLLFGGMRESEPFHLWLNDVQLFPSTGRAQIYLHHPSESNCNIPPYRKMLRKEYLMQRGLKPRNDRSNSKSYRAGWKDLAVDSDYRTEIRLIHAEVEKQFIDWYFEYVLIREECMKVYKNNHGNEHPFLFVKTGDKNDLGAPLSIKAYIAALKRAIARLDKLGYIADYGYAEGICPHPMRHWFITKLDENGVSAKIIQELANHRNILSQEIYKGVTAQELDRAMKDITANYTINLQG